ncbi:MAG TPA: CidA/LrgA family protein [Acidobacteriaceae bacterium]|nr:CidA/LrgA family protein [Acidobacteriaceae bacterium]
MRAFFVLLLFQLIGECLYRVLHLPIPGPVIGMALLTAWLLWRPSSLDAEMETTAWGLLRILGLLFVPAGVGIVANLALLRAQWWPIAAGLVGSTALSLIVTAWVMHWLLKRRGAAAESEA